MNIAIIGNGGREHSLAWKLSQNSDIEKIYCIPGNGGTYFEKKCININLTNINDIVSFVKKENVYMTVVGPESYLIEGIVDEFEKNNLRIIGPNKNASRLEGSKAFAKNFMKKYKIKTADFKEFIDKEKALEYLTICNFPIVIKADGLASGKGVYICKNISDANKAIEDLMIKKVFQKSGEKIIIEDFLNGYEASVLSITDGKTILPFISCKDHKKIYDNENGPNTGGMGVISPNPYFNNILEKKFKKDILNPTLNGLKKEKIEFKGIIFFGLMLVNEEVFLLEYNVRFGDPETQAILPLMKNDLFELFNETYNESLESYKIEWKNKHSCCVVAVSGGYPKSFEKGFNIQGLEKVKNFLFHAGTKYDGISKNHLTNSGRVLSIVSLDKNKQCAVNNAYKDIEHIDFQNIYYRKDIGGGIKCLKGDI